MKKSNPKPKKYLSDGTEAKVGMLVTCTSYNFTGKILSLYKKSSSEIECPDEIFIEREYGHHGNDHLPKRSNKLGWFTFFKEVRKATPEERKQYYARLAQ